MFREPKYLSAMDRAQLELTEDVFVSASGSIIDKLDAFTKFVSRRTLAKFLVRYEIFKKIIEVNGSIIECGVMNGAGIFTYAHLSSIFEPVNHTRKIVGFDTFEGFPSVHEKDTGTGISSHLESGGLAGSSLEDLQRAVELFDSNRTLAHIPKIELVKGDITKTAPEYLQNNPHLVVALLYLDLDLYEPTKAALKTFLPRMPKGAIVVFDELNTQTFPGETLAVDEVLGISNVKIERLPLDPYVSYCIL
ncbi:TylF/MycF family methyltransferase [Merismopedia glauca]|uniref:TylF/MycF family methyltransferase n=1 Tax=Merismopedia glauca TaxID=292586 RepID=UPI001C6397E5|nr:TylF/MycF family methyltransferase [Merismopedia glauca]